MSDTIMYVVGNVGGAVDMREVSGGSKLTTFRLASTPRYWDRGKRAYVDGTTSWFNVQCWRGLAEHVHASVGSGDPVIVIGKLRTQEWEKDEQRHSRFILEATSVGHDLSRGVSVFRRVTRQTDVPPDHVRAAIEAAHDVETATRDLVAAPKPFAETQLRDVS